MKKLKFMDTIVSPNTRESLTYDLKQLGVREGMVIIVHSSLSSLGWVCGGETAVIQALMDVVGEKGTIVMPAQTVDNSDPAEWENPPVPKAWWQLIREQMPAFQKEITPTTGMGRIAEAFRTFPSVIRSNHPTYSFTAWGNDAAYILSEQPLEAGLGERSPLAKIFELNGYILLIGVGHDNNTSLHLAEHDIEGRKKLKKGSAILENGSRVWKEYEEIIYDSDTFVNLGNDFEKEYSIRKGMIGAANCKLMNQQEIILFAKDWLNKNLED